MHVFFARDGAVSASVLLLMALSSCELRPDAATPTSPTPPALAAFVTADVAAQLNPDGTFPLPAPVSDRPIISAAQASQYAELVVRQYASTIAPDLEAQHGGPVDFANARSCGAPLFARSAFTSLPADFPDGLVFHFGSYWLVPICGGSGVRELSIAIAATATTTEIVDGRLRVPANSVKMVGIPLSWTSALPASAEQAALIAAQQTSRRVSAIPILFLPNPNDAFPQGAYWVVQLDGEVSVRGEKSSSVQRRQSVIVGSEESGPNPMYRGPVGLFTETVGGRRELNVAVDINDRKISAKLSVATGAALDMEKSTVLPEER